jgi:amino acid transporter
MENPQSTNQLKKNSVTFFGAFAISAAFMGPAVSVFFNMPPAARAGGGAFPLAFLIAMVAVLFIANSVIQFSKKVNGAGFAFTYTSQGIGPKSGFIAGWTLLLAYGMISPITYAGFGEMLSEFLDRQFGIHVSWIPFFIIIALAVSILSYFGVNHSTVATMIFLILEVIIVLMAIVGVLNGGGGSHLSIDPLLPSSASGGISSIGLAMVFAVLSFTGFEAAANLGEEVKDARRTVPRAIIVSVIAIGIFYVLGAYSVSIFFNDAQAVADNPAPFDTIARSLWGDNLAWIITLTALNSVFANAVAGQTSVVRNIFSLGREGILPRYLGKTNKNGAPTNAIIFDLLLAAVLGLGIGLWKDGWAVWGLLGTIMALGLMVVYGIVCVALPFFYLRKHRSEFSVWKHLIFPIIGLLMLLFPFYSSIYPVPDFPNNLAPYVLIGWVIIGLVYLKWMTSKKPELVQTFGSIFREDSVPIESHKDGKTPVPAASISAD